MITPRSPYLVNGGIISDDAGPFAMMTNHVDAERKRKEIKNAGRAIECVVEIARYLDRIRSSGQVWTDEQYQVYTHCQDIIQDMEDVAKPTRSTIFVEPICEWSV